MFTEEFDLLDKTTHKGFPSRFPIASSPQFLKRTGKNYDSVLFRPRPFVRRSAYGSPLAIRQDSLVDRSARPDDYTSVRFDSRNSVVRVQRARTSSSRSELNRPRRDRKVYGRYAAFLSLVNRTYGRYSEWNEVAEAYSSTLLQGGTPLDLMEALLINEAIDRVYGTRMRLLKRFVYTQPWYTLPIGIDALSNFWRHY